jgi:hypothetical protein
MKTSSFLMSVDNGSSINAETRQILLNLHIIISSALVIVLHETAAA